MAKKRNKKGTPQGIERYNAPALEKGLDVLELLSTDAAGKTQKQIAEGIHRSASEVYRMIASLEQRGFIERTRPGDTYRLTPKMFELSHRHPPTQNLLAAALPTMRSLAVTIRQSCHLSVQFGKDMIIIAQVDSPGIHGFSVRVGARVRLTETTSGVVFLAFAEKTLAGELVASVTADKASRVELNEQLDIIRQAGYTQADSRQIEGIIDIAAPVLDHTGAAAASLAVPFLVLRGPRPSLDDERMHLMEAAGQISRAIGGRAGEAQ